MIRVQRAFPPVADFPRQPTGKGRLGGTMMRRAVTMTAATARLGRVTMPQLWGRLPSIAAMGHGRCGGHRASIAAYSTGAGVAGPAVDSEPILILRPKPERPSETEDKLRARLL